MKQIKLVKSDAWYPYRKELDGLSISVVRCGDGMSECKLIGDGIRAVLKRNNWENYFLLLDKSIVSVRAKRKAAR